MQNSFCPDPSLEAMKCLTPAFLRNAGKRSDLSKIDEMFVKFFSLNPIVNIKCGQYDITDQVRSYNFTSGITIPCKKEIDITLIEEDIISNDKGSISITCGSFTKKGVHVITTTLNDSLVKLVDEVFPDSTTAQAFVAADKAYYSLGFEMNTCCVKENEEGALIDAILYKNDGSIDSSANNALELNSCYASSLFLDTSFLLLGTILVGTIAFE